MDNKKPSMLWQIIRWTEAIQIANTAVQWMLAVSGAVGFVTFLAGLWNDLPIAVIIPCVLVSLLVALVLSCIVVRVAMYVSAKFAPKSESEELPLAVVIESPELIGQLTIEYDEEKHFTRHPNGDSEVRLLVRNASNQLAKRFRITLESLVALSNKAEAKPYSTQFNALRLQVVRHEPGSSLHAGGVAEVIAIKAPKSGEFFFLDGYDVKGQPSTFRTVRAKYEMTITATSHDSTVPCIARFIVTPRKNGEIIFEHAKKEAKT